MLSWANESLLADGRGLSDTVDATAQDVDLIDAPCRAVAAMSAESAAPMATDCASSERLATESRIDSSRSPFASYGLLGQTILSPG